MAKGIHANGGMGRSNKKAGLIKASARRECPISSPSGTPTPIATPNPIATSIRLWNTCWCSLPLP